MSTTTSKRPSVQVGDIVWLQTVDPLFCEVTEVREDGTISATLTDAMEFDASFDPDSEVWVGTDAT